MSSQFESDGFFSQVLVSNMSATCVPKTSVDQLMPSAKRHCGRYSLVMTNFPEAVFTNPTWIQEFFRPVQVKSFEYIFSESDENTGHTDEWRVTFSSEHEKNVALVEKQWQVNESDRLIRLLY